MCGIVGYVGAKDAVPILMNGLKYLEYRGYDSAGVAVLNGGSIADSKCEGKLSGLEELIHNNPLKGVVGIGHTRWATHGRPSDLNAHPHSDCKRRIAVVHNGIIENYLHLKEWLVEKGHVFKSETDTEIIAHLIEEFYDNSLEEAVRLALQHVQGSYAIGAISKDEPEKLVAARKDSPLVIGIGQDENFLASDIPAFLTYTRQAIVMHDGEIAVVTRKSVDLMDLKGVPVHRAGFQVLWDAKMAEKGGYKHFMLKEIHEQPKVVQDTMAGWIDNKAMKVILDPLPFNVSQVEKIFIVGCGTAYHAGMIGKYLLEELTRIPVEVVLASEFRYSNPVFSPGTVVLAISQSGETTDTLAAVREANRQGAKIVAITNIVDSSISREAYPLYMRAGLEIGVAATKTFLAQLTTLYLLSIFLAEERGSCPESKLREMTCALLELPQNIDLTINKVQEVFLCAKRFSGCRDFLFLGRNINYPIALEGALKLKEISYIHAEGYAAGEMKHGPIALIDEHVPVVAIVPKGWVYEKMLSNIQEVKSRDATVIAVAYSTDTEITKYVDFVLPIPEVPYLFSPFLTILPLQLLAYHIADRKGCDVDQPRNLAKSVTVE